MTGGVSHVDSFDPKPRLFSDHGKEIKAAHPEIKDRPGYERIFLKRPQWEFGAHGKSGTQVSSLFPHMAECVDDFALIRSMHTSHSNHFNATLGMHTGSFTFARPSMGSWLSYGLGSMNRNLPTFVVLAPQQPYAGGQVWASDFLPAEHRARGCTGRGAGGQHQTSRCVSASPGAGTGCFAPAECGAFGGTCGGRATGSANGFI